MAQIFDTNDVAMPSTPFKGDSIVRNSDTVPDYSPGAVPQYVANDTSTANASDSVLNSFAQKRAPEVSIMPVTQHHSHEHHNHPVLPIGNVFQDIRHHLQCHSLFNTNIEMLLSQFMTMKHDLDTANIDLARARREAQREREEKEGYKLECEGLKIALAENQAELSQTRADMVASEERLRLAIVQLDQAAQRLEKLRTELRVIMRERDELVRELADKVRELEYYTKRATELKDALDVANAGENAANDRNARLTHLLYQIEDSKAHIERKKDHAEAHVRELDDAIKRLREDPKRGVGAERIIIKLRKEIADLEYKVLQLTSDLDEARGTIVNRDGQIQRTLEGIDELRKEIGDHKSRIEVLNGIVDGYRITVKYLPHRECKDAFKKNTLRLFSNEDDTETADLEDVVNTAMDTKPDDSEAYSTGFEAPADKELTSTAEQAVPEAADKVEPSSPPNGNQTSTPATTAENAEKEETKTE